MGGIQEAVDTAIYIYICIYSIYLEVGGDPPSGRHRYGYRRVILYLYIYIHNVLCMSTKRSFMTPPIHLERRSSRVSRACGHWGDLENCDKMTILECHTCFKHRVVFWKSQLAHTPLPLEYVRSPFPVNHDLLDLVYGLSGCSFHDLSKNLESNTRYQTMWQLVQNNHTSTRSMYMRAI